MKTSGSKTIKLIFIALLLVYQAVSQELSSTLHSTPYGVQVAYTNEMVVFTCVVRGSNSMAWTSDEYIGPGLRLPLVSVQSIGHEVRAVGNEQTVAAIVNTTTDIDVIIVSELRIRINSSYPVASVRCVNSGANTETSISFLLAGAALVTCDRQSVCPGETVTCTCATGNSNSLAWISNGNRLEFMANDSLMIRHNVRGSNAFVMLTEISDTNEVRVITSIFTINTSMNSNDPEIIILTCENVDRATTKPTIIPMAENCAVNPTDDPTGQVTTHAESENVSARDTCTGPIAAAFVAPLIIIIVAAVVIMIIITITYKWSQTRFSENNKKLREEKVTLSNAIKEKDEQIKANESELDELRSKMEEKETALRKLTAQMTTEKQKALEELKTTMKEEQKKTLNALKDTVKEELGEALSQETKAETDKALERIESKMDKEIQNILENKKETSASVIWNILSTINPLRLIK